MSHSLNVGGTKGVPDREWGQPEEENPFIQPIKYARPISYFVSTPTLVTGAIDLNPLIAIITPPQ